MNELQFSKVKNAEGFIAALDQSGGSTPKALKLYGIQDGAYSGDEEMFDLVHAMRTRIITSPSFKGDRILGAILFEMTMDRQIEGRGSADYLWNVKNVVPFVKVDKGLADEVDGAQVMKPMPDLDALLLRAVEKGVFGTKMRSVIKLGNSTGVQAVVDQQFEVGRQILAGGLALPDDVRHCTGLVKNGFRSLGDRAARNFGSSNARGFSGHTRGDLGRGGPARTGTSRGVKRRRPARRR